MNAEQKEVLAHLVVMRHAARQCIEIQNANRRVTANLETARKKAIQCGDTEGEAVAKTRLDQAKEIGFELKFKIIEIGKSFIAASGLYDQLPREVWLRALSVNESEWNSPDMLKYGYAIRNVVAVLNLENSATKDGSPVHKPLNWCCTMGFLHTSRTNPELGRVIHDAANEVFGGNVFGEYQEPTMLERMGVAMT